MEANHPPAVEARTEPSAAPAEAGPDWASARDLHCPLCNYNLRGLTEPRCPECGYRFEWAELLDEKLKIHPYLFEHHPERNVWSFGKTLVGGLRPAKFWATLHPGQTLRPGRLLLYWVIVMLVAGVASVATTLAVGCVLENAQEAAYRRMYWGGRYGQPFVGMGGQVLYMWPDGKARPTRPPELGHFSRHGWERAWDTFGGYYAVGWVVACTWPWATLLTLMIFQASMRRAKVRPGHVRRCVLYSFDAILWGGLLVAALRAVTMLRWVGGGSYDMSHEWVVYALPALWAAVTYRLGRAYGRYLQFDRPWATVIASQVIVALAGLILLVNLSSSTFILNLMELV